MKKDEVSLAIGKLVAGIDALGVQLSREASAAYQENRYEDTEEISASLKSLKRFKSKFENINSEWHANVDAHVRQRVKLELHQPGRSPAKGVPRKLRVTLPSGRVIQRPTPAITMAEAIEAMGIAKVNALGITVCGAPLLSLEKNSNYETRIGKYFIYTQGNLKNKKHILEAVSTKLGYDVKIEIF